MRIEPTYWPYNNSPDLCEQIMHIAVVIRSICEENDLNKNLVIEDVSAVINRGWNSDNEGDEND